MKGSNIYGADFETDYSIDDDGIITAKVVQYALTDTTQYHTGTNPYDFLADVVAEWEHHKEMFVYFHNLKYDIEFMLEDLYELCEYNEIEPFIIRRKGAIISFTLEIGDSKLHFRDSSKKYPMSLMNVGKMIGIEKLDGFDFYSGWSDDVDFSDVKNWDYVKNDAYIVAYSMQHTHALGHTKSTSSGDALKHAKKIISGKDGRLHKVCYKWLDIFPRIPIELDKRIRLAYFGGINLSEKKGYIEGDITHIDVVSMYPTVMCYDPLPYGVPIVQEEMPSDPDVLWIVNCRMKMKVKPDKVAWFSFKSKADCDIEGLSATEHVRECKEWHIMTLTNVDMENIMSNYDVEFDDSFKPIYYVFNSRVGLLSEYIETWMSEKAKAKKGSLEYVKSKLMMNGLYGRLGLSFITEETRLEMDEDGMINWVSTPSENDDNDSYVPYSIFVTAYARKRLLQAVNGVPADCVIHSDTDSLIFLGDVPDTIEIGDNLGQWQVESKPVYMYEGGFKRYFEVLNTPIQSMKDVNMACAGCPNRKNNDGVPIGMWIEILDNPSLISENVELGKFDYQIKSEWLRKIYLDNGLDPDKVDTHKLLPRRVRGGLVLEPTKFTLNDGNFLFQLR